MDWSLAPSLRILRSELNTRWPDRDKTSDGTIGDTSHQASKSDHNPNERGRVDAIDVDNDGIDVWAVFEHIKKHPSARYFIYQGHLYHRLRSWVPENYTGPSPHREHFHLSIDQTATAEEDTRPWGLLGDDVPLTDDDVRKIWGYPVQWRGSSDAKPTVQAATGLYYAQNDAYGATQQLKAVLEAVKELAGDLEAVKAQQAGAVDYDKLAQALLKAALSK